MSDDEREQRLIAEVRRQLDASVEALDPATRSALARARARAVAAREARGLRWRGPAVAALATAGALVLMLWLRVAPPDDAAPIAAGAEAGDPELIEELEFYTWLAEQPDAG